MTVAKELIFPLGSLHIYIYIYIYIYTHTHTHTHVLILFDVGTNFSSAATS
jgi:hypothetical protein